MIILECWFVPYFICFMQKLYYSITEIGQEVDEETHILRYWEKEFPQLNPKKNRAGNRIYSTKDLDLIKLIKKLLRQDKLSVKGAKDKIDYYFDNNIDISKVLSQPKPEKHNKKEQIRVDREFLEEIKNTLSDLSAEIKNEKL